jgi:multidrug efflux pump subunit AcrA (membrane-fusion protein)
MTVAASRRRRRARIAAAAGIGTAVALAGAWWAGGSAGGDREWLTVTRGPLVVGVEVDGTLRAVRSDLLGPPLITGMWNYKLASLVPEGTEVEAGAPVMRFDTSELERRLLDEQAERDHAATELEKLATEVAGERRTAELRLAEAQARLRKAELKTDVPADLVRADELEEARIDLALARDEVAYLERRLGLLALQGRARLAALAERRDRAAGRVEEIEDSIRRMTVAAPRSGTVIYYTARGSEKKKVGDSVWLREQVVEIPDLTRMMAEGDVDEADAGRIAVGQPVTLRLDAHPDRVYRGRVRTIHETVQRRSQASPAKVVRLEVELDATDPERMRPGMRFQGEIEVDRAADALLAPADAVFGSSRGPVTFRRAGLGVEEVRPGIGRRTDRWVEVLAGLEAGDELAPRPPEGWEAER